LGEIIFLEIGKTGTDATTGTAVYKAFPQDIEIASFLF
jgi:hypothetical protein